MSRKTITATLTALAAGAALVPAAMAQSDAVTTVDAVELEGAYAFVDRYPPGAKRYAAVVFRTAGALPRRFDGMLRAGGRLDGTGSSVGSVRGRKGKAAHCYQILVKLQDGRVAGPKGKRAKLGSKHALDVSARGTGGADVSDSMTVKLTRKRVGDRSGKRLGC